MHTLESSGTAVLYIGCVVPKVYVCCVLPKGVCVLLK